MSSKNEEYMSAEELRNRLYHSLRDKGLVNSMKSQLRTSLVTELKKSVHGRLTVEDLEVPESGSLIHRASNSLVADHLLSCKYDYTYSVFLPESGIDKTKMLGNEDILQLLKISPQSRLFKKMTVHHQGRSRKGFIWQLLSELCAIHSQPSQSAGTQTDLIKVATISTLDEKMNVLDELFSSRREEQYPTGATALEDRLLKFQRQIEERFKNEMKLEVSRVKDEEVARIRLEEKENFRRELDKARKEMERTYQAKFDALVIRERNATERLQREQEMQEKEIYNQRQSILEEIEAVRQREASIKREMEVFGREKHLERDRVKALEQELRRREQEIQRKEREFDQRLENEMTKFKVEYQAKFLERTQNLEVREASLRENERRVSEDQQKQESLKNDLRDKTARVNELETLLQEARHKEVGATKHNEFLNAKLRDMADYASIKDQNISLRTDLENLKTRMAEIMQLNERERIRQEELLRELRRPTAMPEYAERRSSDRYERSPRHDRYRSSRYDEDAKDNRLMSQFEAQTLQMKEMGQELVDLKQTLTYTQKALHNEVYRKPQDTDTSRLVSFNLSRRSRGAAGVVDTDSDHDLSHRGQRRGRRSKTPPMVDRDDVYNDIDLEDFSVQKVSTEFTTDGEESSNQSADIVAETKYRLKSLEKEAQNLEKAYMDFHYQLTNPSSVPDPTRHSFRKSLQGDRSGSKGHHMPSPKASPIASARPLSSTPYHQAKPGEDPDASTDSLTELKGSSSYGRKKMSGQDEVPKFSLSDVSDDDIKSHEGERVEKPRPITVDDLEARPGSPSIMVVQADPSSDGGNSPKENVSTQPSRSSVKQQKRETTLPAPTKLPPLSLDTAWKAPALDEAWNTGEKYKEEKEEEDRRWEEEQRRKEEERKWKEQEAWEREQRELEKMEMGEKQDSDTEEADKGQEEKSDKSDQIDPVMKKYMELVQQQKSAPQQEKQESEKTASQIEDDLSLTEEVKGDDGDDSEDDFNW